MNLPKERVLEKGGTKMVVFKCWRVPALAPGVSKEEFWRRVRRRLARMLRGEESPRERRERVGVWLAETERELALVETAQAAFEGEEPSSAAS